MRDITELPHDLFLIVISHLSPQACVRCRSVSRRWHHAFTDEANCLLLLRWNFPRCREMRLTFLSSSSPPPQKSADNLPPNLRAELVQFAQAPRVWSTTFAHVARRYHHLNRATARAVEKLDMAPSQNKLFSFWGVAPWNRYLRLNEKTASFHYPDPSWWYSQEDAVLVYPATQAKGDSPPLETTGHIYHIIDLSTNLEFPVPFDVRQKHIRRVRLAQGVLIFEWAEVLPYHQLNDREVVHRHYVSVFDVVRHPPPPDPTTTTTTTHCTWTVTFRSEFKLHFLGLPLNRSDRFFSAHTATHYAVYFWQPNRSLYQDDPIEQLAVWDISSPSPYRPSEDPKGRKRPTVERTPSLPTGLWSGKSQTAASSSTTTTSSHSPPPAELPNDAASSDMEQPRRYSPPQNTPGPSVIRRIAWPQLDFYGLRQRATPQLRNLSLDERNLYFVEEEHRWADGQHSSLSPPRVHLVRSTGIPIIPFDTDHDDTQPGQGQGQNQVAVQGPVSLDSCGADGSDEVNMSFCRRVSPPTAASMWPPPTMASLNAASWSEGNLIGECLQPGGKTSPRGWPWDLGAGGGGWKHAAPCWRHEDFPYLTVSEMVDGEAGVRVSARHCFMLETLSVHVRPGITVRGSGLDAGGGGGKEKGKGKGRVKERDEVKRTKEKEFGVRREDGGEVNMWAELLAKGHISGDERWVVGEDEEGRITVVRF
ncbi:hypothetical protein QBC41DRAFT_338444 [Cercophora samala]|uniref:F-box domain-containing protein n=1 Tax=Cercophora samala TaxID=330535 RepID=A0AA39ZB50_9PEZI|nr:hypothetical protein QBC41DRAFT_338444 [Cercophora samala]